MSSGPAKVMIVSFPVPAGSPAMHTAVRAKLEDMLTDVAVVVAEPVPAFELGIVSEIFGLPRADPSLPRYSYAVCAEQRTTMRTSSGFAVTPTHDLSRLGTADLVV